MSSHHDLPFQAEYAKSGRSSCKKCKQAISQDSLPIFFLFQSPHFDGKVPNWFHFECFWTRGKCKNPDDIYNFHSLRWEDQQKIKNKIGGGGAADKVAAGTSNSTSANDAEEFATEYAKSGRSQCRGCDSFIAKDSLRVSKKEFESQRAVMYGPQDLWHHVDCFVKNREELGFTSEMSPTESEGYACTGNLTEWTKCMNITKAPKRKAFKIPKEFHDVHFLGTSKPLKDLRLAVRGRLSKKQPEIIKEITDLGGIVKKVDSRTVVIISCKEEVESNTKHMNRARLNNIPVVSEEFLSACTGGDLVEAIKKCSIAPWGSNVQLRVSQLKSAPKSGMSAREEAKYTKSVPAKVKMTVKGGAAVDPDSELAEVAHVIKEQGEPLTAVLGLVDIARGTNSFYKLQALESDSENRWWVFRAWGRVGTTIGGNKLEKFSTKKFALEKFKELYIDKTGNEWENRKTFLKMPNKFYPLEIDYGQDEENIKKLDLATSNSTLPKSVQNLICMIFDVESMIKAMMEFEIDMKKMPLGKLSKRQIQSAYSILTELQKLIETKGSQSQFVDATNRFYTSVPHDFGLKKPPLLDTSEIIKQKTDMLDNLLEIEVAYSLLKGGDEGEDPITAHYKKLKCQLEPLDPASDEFERLKTYTKNTHASTHNMYDLEIMDVLKVVREGESKMFRPFKELNNRMLLWHGSRATNFAGILSQGLRIAPPEAPVTGYMFGKGVYFADMVSKSANYCCTSKTNNIGVLLLCEVALGNM
uniref:Poly [ADP-ribose] polymerase n=1 Tax=Biomphalaria glabrata TaxID=6526 RepID=A0A182YTW7_BIOGL